MSISKRCLNHGLVFLAAVFIITGCATVPTDDIKINIEVDPKANLKGYKTYNWAGSAALVYDPSGQWEPPELDLDSEFRFLIDREMRAKGFTQSTTDPDLLVGYVAGIDMDAIEFKKKPESNLKVLQNVPKGALIVVLIDTNTQFPVWAGEAVADIQQKMTPELTKGRLDYVVSKMFADLPR